MMVSMKMQLTRHINQSPQYMVDRSSVPIHFVSTKKDWVYCAGRLLNAQLMGLDTETRPTWGRQKKKKQCALLQIAVRDAQKKEEVFILDLLNLRATTYNGTLTNVFLSKKIIKLGQSFYQDLQELAQSYPHASCFQVCKGVVEVNDLSISLAGAHNPISLQKLVFFYLHRKLAKTQQLSNWERRPLTVGQLHYAAADALVLLHLYDELLLRIQRQCIAMTKSFRLSDVTNVLDVNLPPASKCSLCFEVFETKNALKQHRQLCLTEVHKLMICAVCDGKKLETEKGMEHHVKHCGIDEAADEPVVQGKKKRSLSGISSISVTKSLHPASDLPKSKKRRKTNQDAPCTAARIVEDSNLASAKRDKNRKDKKARKKRQRELKAQTLVLLNAQMAAKCAASQTTNTLSCRDTEHKPRGISMESSLLASDAMWSQISSECDSTTAT
ncbi:hypothetical protein DD238_008167 [Peronospora effusa]|uniref:3'-5' exonuclease domain-containing protein n=1 Tax=Peronospora effusa TaxID=542832 RepID=A0A3M6VP63_9STRA|nr:hypothetical protein DD238_008167 [Peronospora effusa]